MKNGWLVRFIEAKTPSISSVGHETDTTIADLVADVRAATYRRRQLSWLFQYYPEELMRIKERQARLEQGVLRQIQRKQERFARSRQSMSFANLNDFMRDKRSN